MYKHSFVILWMFHFHSTLFLLHGYNRSGGGLWFSLRDFQLMLGSGCGIICNCAESCSGAPHLSGKPKGLLIDKAGRLWASIAVVCFQAKYLYWVAFGFRALGKMGKKWAVRLQRPPNKGLKRAEIFCSVSLGLVWFCIEVNADGWLSGRWWVRWCQG